MAKVLKITNTETPLVDIENVDGTVDFNFGGIGTPTSLSSEYNDGVGRVGYDNTVYDGAVNPDISSDKQGQYQLVNSTGQLTTAHSEFIGISRFDMRGGGAYSPGFASDTNIYNSATGTITQDNETYNTQRGFSRDISSSYNGYLLSDPWHYPMMENGSVKKPVTDGDKIESSLTEITILGSVLTPFTITSETNLVSIKVNNGVKISHTLVIGTKHITDMVTELNGLFGIVDFEFSNSNNNLKLVGKTNTNSLELVLEQYSAFISLGFSYGIYRKESNRIISVTKYETDYHPLGLLACTPLVLSGDTLTGGVPKARNHWLYIVQNDTPQNFVLDLLNTPFETERRDWRETAPHWEMANAICQNKECPVGWRGFTVDQWRAYIQSGSNQSFNMIQSNSTKCSECGYDLTTAPGAMNIGGDGLKTYYYQDFFAEDAFITKIVADSKGEVTALQVHKTSYSVQIKASTNDYWETVLSVFYINSLDKYFWIDDEGDEHLEFEPPIEWDFRKRRLRARYVRFNSTSNRYPIVFVGTGSWNVTDKRYNIEGDFAEGYFVDCKLETGTLVDGLITYTDTRNITNSNRLGVGSQNYAYVEGEIPLANVYYRITKYQFVGGCAKLEVYGINYIPTDITITPTAEIETFSFSGNITEFVMTNQPTQIVGVWAGNVESNVELEPVNEIIIGEFVWETKIFSMNDINGNPVEFKLIVGGKYYYQYSTNKVILPTVDQYGENIYEINKNLDPAVFSRQVVPSTVTVKYWQGAGVGITMNIEADGRGPSYQLEREAVNSILSELDGLGQSVPLGGDDKKYKRTVKWYCYNHDPIIWETQKKTLYGTELGGNWSLGKFREIFGQHGTLVGSKKAKGTVTIYGASDIVLSGTLLVEAPPITTHSIGSYTWGERTGGISEAGFLIELDVNPNGGHRKTLAYSPPGIIVYAREKTL